MGWDNVSRQLFSTAAPLSLFPLSPLQITPAHPCQLPCRDLGLPVCPNHMSLQNCPLVAYFPLHFPAFLLHAGIPPSPQLETEVKHLKSKQNYFTSQTGSVLCILLKISLHGFVQLYICFLYLNRNNFIQRKFYT